jgi:hypothetical protein
MRAYVLAIAALLTGCTAEAQTLAQPPAEHGRAFVDVSRVLHDDPRYPALAVEDRQIATLERTLARHIAMPQDAMQAQTQAAIGVSSRLAGAAASYAPSATSMLDPHTIESSIARTYATQASAVRSKAQASQDAYAQALRAAQGTQRAALAVALNRRVTQAYALRAQALREHESDTALAREEKVAGQQASLRAKAAAALPSRRAPYVHELNAIAAALAAASAADRARDAATLASYAASLRSAAADEYAQTLSGLAAKSAANFRLRSKVTRAQLASPSSMTLPVDSTFDGTMRANGSELQRYAASGSSNDAAQTRSDLAAAEARIGARFSAVKTEDERAYAAASAQLVTMRRSRAALYAGLIASIQREARRQAQARHLTLSQRRPGAVDLTDGVARSLAKTYGS